MRSATGPTWAPFRFRSRSISGPASSRHRLLLVFLDGVGIGARDRTTNPFFAARLPTIERILGELPSLSEQVVEGSLGSAFPLDATLDTPGTPQSGTGQTALLTGVNAAEIFGRHFGPWVPTALRPVVEERSLLRRAVDRGMDAAFANAYPRGWPGPRGGRRIAGPPLAARGAGLLDRHEEALGRAEAVSSEIVNTGWREQLGHDWLPEVTPVAAGRSLGRIASGHDLTLFAHYSTDGAGHQKAMDPAVHSLERVDSFLHGVLDAMGEDVTLLVVSDHGNVEDVTVGHTRNPALGLAVGPARGGAAGLRDLRAVADYVDETAGTPIDP